MPAYNETQDNNSRGYGGTTQRCKLTSNFREAVAVTTTETELFTVDSAEFGGVSCALTVFNRAASAASVRLRCYVSNDRAVGVPSNGGRITVSTLYDEAGATVSIPLTIAAGATDHVILDYASLPKLTCFRFWTFTIDVAANSATVDYYFGCK